MNKHIPSVFISIPFFAACLGVACSGSEEDFQLDQEEELSTLEQGFISSQSPSFQLGTRTASTRQRCDLVTAGQSCVIPKGKTLSVCIHTSSITTQTFTTAERAQVVTIVNSLDTIPGWTFNIFTQPGGLTSVDCDQVNPLSDIIVRPSGVGNSGTASADIKDYATVNWAGLVNLTEGPDVVGTFQNWTRCTALVDRVDILAKGTSSTQDTNGLNHGIAHAFEGCLGIGGRSGDGGRASRNLFSPASTAVNISSGESCALANLSLGSPGQFLTAPVGCPND